ncbi:Amidase [Rhizoctonia solani]|uniref:Amidase n=1 Tax=Rhizoctonia solani TaxID=456999 RepID=A0A8H7LJ09_9AGAM|nr:Amidase [Rhizoctonia solani]
MSMTWEAIATQKLNDRASRLRSYADWSLEGAAPSPSQKSITSLVHGRLTEREKSFFVTDVTDLAQRLASRECTAVEVITAFCKATYVAQELTNCITEIMFDQAFAQARELDDHISKTGKTIGPFHGVPISVKDRISVKGEDTACGYVAWAGKKIAQEDAPIVQILRAAGALIYVKTTNPQSLFVFETSSNIYGYTTNPYNRSLSSGGSSGGEGALIGARGSLLGVGSDILGSIRFVQANLARLTNILIYHTVPGIPSPGSMAGYKGMENLVGVVGPMAHSVRDLELFCRTILEYEPWTIDFKTLHMPWNHSVAQRKEGRKLVIGIFIDDGVVAPHPPIVGALHRARNALVHAGHEVIDWEPMDHEQAIEVVSRLYMLDAGNEIRSVLDESGEPPIPSVARILVEAEKHGVSTLAESWEMNSKRDIFRARALAYWNETALRTTSRRPVDAVLCPASATLAPPHWTMRWFGYTAYWNLLDFPAAVFPLKKLFDASQWKPENHTAYANPRNAIEEFVANQWDPETYDNAPVALQLVGRRWQEEKLIADLRIVDEVVAQHVS